MAWASSSALRVCGDLRVLRGCRSSIGARGIGARGIGRGTRVRIRVGVVGSHVTRVRSRNRVRGYQSSIEQSVADADTERRADGYLREQARLQLMNVRIDPAALGQSSSSLLRIAQGITYNGMSDDALALLFGATYAPNPPEQPKAVEEPLKPSEAAPVDWRKRSVRFKR